VAGGGRAHKNFASATEGLSESRKKCLSAANSAFLEYLKGVTFYTVDKQRIDIKSIEQLKDFWMKGRSKVSDLTEDEISSIKEEVAEIYGTFASYLVSKGLAASTITNYTRDIKAELSDMFQFLANTLDKLNLR